MTNPLCSVKKCRFGRGDVRKLEGAPVCRQCWEAIIRERLAHNRRYQYDARFVQFSVPEWTALESVLPDNQ